MVRRVSGAKTDRDPAKKYFDPETTDRERAIFEGGITLGALYHQFIGASIQDVEVLKRAIEQAALAQPFVESADVKITLPKRKPKPPYVYPELTGKMLSITLTTKYGRAQARLGMRHVPDLDYPLMFIEFRGTKKSSC
jgi:hypothetical protein